MMKIEEYHNNKKLSDLAIPHWKKYIEENLFGPKLTLGVIDLQGEQYKKFQKSKFGDMVIIIDDDEGKQFWTIETKIRKESDEKYFLAYNDIAIETKGNCDKLDDDGSALHNSKADLFGTAFYSPMEGLKHVHIFKLKDGLREWLIQHRHEYTERENITDGLYKACWIAVPVDDIKQFLL